MPTLNKFSFYTFITKLSALVILAIVMTAGVTIQAQTSNGTLTINSYSPAGPGSSVGLGLVGCVGSTIIDIVNLTNDTANYNYAPGNYTLRVYSVDSGFPLAFTPQSEWCLPVNTDKIGASEGEFAFTIVANQKTLITITPFNGQNNPGQVTVKNPTNYSTVRTGGHSNQSQITFVILGIVLISLFALNLTKESE